MNHTFSEVFIKEYRKLTKNEQKQFDNKLKIFLNNYLHPSLRTKKIKGTDDLYEFSVNMSIRVIWHFDDECFCFVEIGHHNILNKYRRGH